MGRFSRIHETKQSQSYLDPRVTFLQCKVLLRKEPVGLVSRLVSMVEWIFTAWEVWVEFLVKVLSLCTGTGERK